MSLFPISAILRLVDEPICVTYEPPHEAKEKRKQRFKRVFVLEDHLLKLLFEETGKHFPTENTLDAGTHL
jgi:hypothetical protein